MTGRRDVELGGGEREQLDLSEGVPNYVKSGSRCRLSRAHN